MAQGILLRVTHTGKSMGSVHISDIRDGIDVRGGAFGFRKSGAIYVPTPENGGEALLVYAGDVAVSFEGGGIRQFIEGGYLLAEFVAGDTFKGVLPDILDEGVLLTETPTEINFVGSGVTATNVGTSVTVNIPGGGGGAADHTTLANLGWAISGHTGPAGSLAAFTAGSSASLITGGVHGDVLFFNGSDWTTLSPGANGQVLQTQGAGSDPQWVSSAGTGDVTAAASLTDNAIVRGDGGAKGVQDSGVLIDDSNNMSLPNGATLTVDSISESTLNNGVVVNGVRNYGKSAVNPMAPPPTDGDTYYNTVLRMQMTYDGLRSKWLSIEAETIQFGRNGNVGANQYFRAINGRIMSASLGHYAERSGTIVSLSYTRSNSDAAIFDIEASGVSTGSVVPTASTSGRSITLNSDFNFGDILAVRNTGANVMSDVIAKFRVRWRV